MADEDERVEIEVGEEGLRVSAREGGVSSAARFVFPKRWLRAQKAKLQARVDDALCDSVVAKLQASDALDEAERYLVVSLFTERLEAHARREALRVEAQKIFPEMEAKMKALPPLKSPGWNQEDWVRQLLAEAEKVTDAGMRDLFARLLAGEAARPGSFHPRTISVVARLDRQTAVTFQKLLSFLVDGLLPLRIPAKWLSLDERHDLGEAGLLNTGSPVTWKYKWDFGEEDAQLDWACAGCNVRIYQALPVGPDRQDTLDVSGYQLTRAGSELSIIPCADAPMGYVRWLVDRRARSALSKRGRTEEAQSQVRGQWRREVSKEDYWQDFTPPVVLANPFARSTRVDPES